MRADADLGPTVENLVDGAFFNSGQSCCGVERIYVHKSLYGDFIDAFAAQVGEYRSVLGDDGCHLREERAPLPDPGQALAEEADSLPKTTTTKLYLLTGLLLPIWKDIPSGNERIYRVTPEGQGSMIGRTVSEDGAAALRARVMGGTPKTPQEMLTAALGHGKMGP